VAKAKQKRAKKEQEKLRRAGRHLEWLVAVQGQGRTPELRCEIDQAWQDVLRRTLRTRQAFDEFCAQIDSIPAVPQTAEMEFLLSLKACMAGDAEAADALLTVGGLAGAYQTVQARLRPVLGPALDWRGIEDRLALLARDPGRISRRHYQDLAGFFAGTPLAPSFQALGDGMAVFRRLNHKTSLHKPLPVNLLADLYEADQRMARATASYLPALRRLVFLPFACQVVLHLRQCHQSPSAHQARELVRAVDEAFTWGTGELMPPELRDLLLADDDNTLTVSGLARMEQNFRSAPFEGKLVLLRDLRQAFGSADPFPGRVDHPLFSGMFGQELEVMERLLLRFHAQMLKEIGRRLPLLSSRERRSLVAVLDPILSQDASDLLVPGANNEALVDLLLQAAGVGCMGPRLAVVASLVAVQADSRRLGTVAATALWDGPGPGAEDLRWIMQEHGPLAVRSPTVLQTLFDSIRADEALVGSLAQAVWEKARTAFLVNSSLPDLPPMLRRLGTTVVSAELFTPATLQGLAELAGQVDTLAPLARFLALFPEGRVNAAGLRQWMAQVWSEADGCLEFVAGVRSLLVEAGEATFLDDLFATAGPATGRGSAVLRLECARAVVDFLRDHADDFRRLPLEAVEALAEKIFPVLEEQPGFPSLLIKTCNALGAREDAGDRQCAALRDALDNRLRAIAGVGRKPARSSRRRS
jgi:hypothetical protein